MSYIQHVVIQPIGKYNTIEDFLENNKERWAEKKRYKKQWLLSEDAIVLFIKDKKIFAKATISKIEHNPGHKSYPLNYYYNDFKRVNNISYNEVIKYAQHKLDNFRTYELLDDKKSKKIINYLDSLEELYINEEQADYELQKKINKIKALAPEEKPQKVKPSKKINGQNIFSRNLSYAKKSLELADFLCEIDKNHSTFISKSSKKQYVEAHHLIPLKFQDEFLYNLDVPANIISLCPNCHRKMHFGNNTDIDKMSEKLFKKRQNELKKYGIEITLDGLKTIYNE